MNNQVLEFKPEYPHLTVTKGFTPSTTEKQQIESMNIVILNWEQFNYAIIPGIIKGACDKIDINNYLWTIDNMNFIHDLNDCVTKRCEWMTGLKNGDIRIGVSLRKYKTGQRRAVLKFWA